MMINQIRILVISVAVSLQAIANPIASNIGNQHIKYLQLDQIDYSSYYPTNGLIEWWDAQWNAGPFKHDASLTQLMPLIDGGTILDVSENAIVNRDSIQTFKNLGGITCNNCSSMTDDGRYVALPMTLIICMQYNEYVESGFLFHIGPPSASTPKMYARNSTLMKWYWHVSNFDCSSISPSIGELVVFAIVFKPYEHRLYMNGKTKTIDTNQYTFCHNTQLSMMCNTDGNSSVSGKFYNAMIFNRALSNEEIDEIAAINMMRYGWKK